MDQMEFFEIRALMKFSYYSHKEEWEQARLISYLIAQTNSTKKLKLFDVIKFPWDIEKPEDTSISNNEVERLKEKAKQFASYLK